MAYIDTPDEGEATGEAAELYERERERVGYLPNFARVFAERPQVYRAWRSLIDAIIEASDFRRFELATLAAARGLRSTYCALAHGAILAKQFYDADTVRTLPDGLDEADAAIMAFAEKVARDAASVTKSDIAHLRALGLTDTDVVDVVLAAAARGFFSTVLDALGAEPDGIFGELEPRLREALTVGRPFTPAG
jgi:uncharacterized peroxidase-related enzyme